MFRALRRSDPLAKPTRVPVVFVAWTSAPERANEIATALGGQAFCHYPMGHLKAIAPLRYVVSGLLTIVFLVRKRPKAVIVTNPPIFPALIALAYARLTGAPFLLDSHPGGFGLQGDRLSARLQPIVRWVARRARATLVTEASLSATVQSWGGRAQIVHEAPPAWEPQEATSSQSGAEVLFICTFNRDEPVQAVIDAARSLPGVRFKVTGDLRKSPPGLVETAPENVDFVGFLRGPDYVAALASCDLTIVLTTEPTSVVKAGFETVYAKRPLLVSDWPAAREVFPTAFFVDNTGESIGAALSEALAAYPDIEAKTPGARASQDERWRKQEQALRALIQR